VDFWREVAAGFLGNVAAGVLLVVFYFVIQWFLAATDIVVGYNWRFDGDMSAPRNIRPSFDIRNRSRSKTYYLANIGYLIDARPVASFDNKSVWGTQLKPGTIVHVEAAPIVNPKFTSLAQCTATEVHVRLQNGRMFWLKGAGPGQLRIGRIQRAAFSLRDRLERAAIPME
jgi:hypothetical protein